MASTIKIKRGLKVNLPILSRGELGYATDTKELFIGVLESPIEIADNVLISSIGDFYTKSEFVSLDGTGLIWSTENEEFSIDFATEEEAQTGTNDTKVMNPLRTADAITAQTSAILTTGEYITQTNLNSAIAGLGGTGLTVTEGVINIDDPFDPSGTYPNLRAQSTTATDVGLGNVTDESKATMFNNPTFTNTVTIAGDNPKLTGLPIPVDSTDAANKSYVDALAQGIKSRTQASVLVDSNLAGTYDTVPELHEITSSTNGAFPTTDGVDSSILNVVGMRFVLAGQTNKEENGLYVLKTAGDASNPWVLRRCTECDTSAKIPGSFVFITKGTLYENTGWLFDVDNPSTFTIGVDDINVIQFSGAGSFTAGNGLTLTGTEFTIDTAVTMDLGSAQTVTGIKTFNETILGAVTGVEETNNSDVLAFWTGTETEYNNIGTKNADTLYFILEN